MYKLFKVDFTFSKLLFFHASEKGEKAKKIIEKKLRCIVRLAYKDLYKEDISLLDKTKVRKSPISLGIEIRVSKKKFTPCFYNKMYPF